MTNFEDYIREEIQDDLKKRDLELEKIIKLEGGKNSNSYCLFLPNRKLLLKFFPKKELIVRDRLNSELTFLKFLNDTGHKNIPKPIFSLGILLIVGRLHSKIVSVVNSSLTSQSIFFNLIFTISNGNVFDISDLFIFLFINRPL